MKRVIFLAALSVIVYAGVAGCSTVPEPRSIYQDSLTVIELRFDKRAYREHSHPAALTTEQIAVLLSGIRVHREGLPVYSLIAGSPDALPAFSVRDVIAISRPISEALAKASPKELVTFYRRVSDAAVGLAYTTGGIFVENGLVYVILANHRVQPMDAAVRDVPVYATDPVNDPLLSLGTADFTLSYERPEAEVHPLRQGGRYDPYRTLILNPTLAHKALPSSQPAVP
jgi:hypothetical protein